MTRSHIVLLLALILAVVGVFSACSVQDDAGAQNTPSSSPTTRIGDIPIYPAAVKSDEQCRSDPDDRCKYRLSIRARLQNVADFYKSSLTNRGWAVTSLDVGGITQNIDFTHITRTAEGVSVRRWINLFLEADGEEAIVDVGFERWPDPMAITLPQGAEEVTMSWDNSDDAVELTIAYMCACSPNDILDFHRQNMSDQGWDPGLTSSERDKDSKLLPAFRYSRRDIQGPYLGSYVTLHTTSLEGGRTAVRLIANGRDVTAAYESLHK